MNVHVPFFVVDRSSGNRVNVGAITGGVVGAILAVVILLILIVVILVIILKRRCNDMSNQGTYNADFCRLITYPKGK